MKCSRVKKNGTPKGLAFVLLKSLQFLLKLSPLYVIVMLIMAILYVFKLFATSGAKKPVEAPKAAPAAAPAAPVANDEQLIAAIATAAIAAERGESECAFKVISITKLQ